MEDCYEKNAFSTFGYIFDNLSSSMSIESYNSANCIGLSIYVQNRLLELNITSYLIPASIPKIYQMPEYLDISHVALFIPFKEHGYIIDCAFYFLSPIKINFSNNKCSSILSKKIYNTEIHKNLLEYDSLGMINCNLNITEHDMNLNKYQPIPKNIYYVECHYKGAEKDIWRYYLTNIVNPDEAVSKFFIAVKKNPFICTHIIDDNGIPKCNYYIKFNDHNISIKTNDKTNIYSANEFKLHIEETRDLYKTLNYFFNGNFNNFIEQFYNMY